MLCDSPQHWPVASMMQRCLQGAPLSRSGCGGKAGYANDTPLTCPPTETFFSKQDASMEDACLSSNASRTNLTTSDVLPTRPADTEAGNLEGFRPKALQRRIEGDQTKG